MTGAFCWCVCLLLWFDPSRWVEGVNNSFIHVTPIQIANNRVVYMTLIKEKKYTFYYWPPVTLPLAVSLDDTVRIVIVSLQKETPTDTCVSEQPTGEGFGFGFSFQLLG